jgi:plasmid stability protein
MTRTAQHSSWGAARDRNVLTTALGGEGTRHFAAITARSLDWPVSSQRAHADDGAQPEQRAQASTGITMRGGCVADTGLPLPT